MRASPIERSPEREQLELGDGRGVPLLGHPLERVGDGAREAVDDDVVDKLDVRAPIRRALGDLEHLVRLEEQPVDVLALLADVGVPGGEGALVLLLLHQLPTCIVPQNGVSFCTSGKFCRSCFQGL